MGFLISQLQSLIVFSNLYACSIVLFLNKNRILRQSSNPSYPLWFISTFMTKGSSMSFSPCVVRISFFFFNGYFSYSVHCDAIILHVHRSVFFSVRLSLNIRERGREKEENGVTPISVNDSFFSFDCTVYLAYVQMNRL